MTEPLVIVARPPSKATQAVVARQRAVYLIATGQSDEEIARTVGVAASTVKGWRTLPDIEQAVTEAIAEAGRVEIDRALATVTAALDLLALAMSDTGSVSEKRLRAASETLRAFGGWAPLSAQEKAANRELVESIAQTLQALQQAARGLPGAIPTVPVKAASTAKATQAPAPVEGLTRSERFRQQGSTRTQTQIDSDREIARMSRNRALSGPRALGRNDGWGERR